jgi:threonylcarbamoyladenosine tRNA methylthiotransferase MtaB
MNRRYTTNDYIKIVKELRENIKDVSITTDIIVGFPGETDEEFNQTYRFLEDIKLTKTHIFKYSARTGTKAYEMGDNVPANIKDLRSSKLIELNNINEKSFIEKFIGNDKGVLYEQEIKEKENFYEGYTDNYIKVITEFKDEIPVGKIIKTKLMDAEIDFAYGKICTR